MDETAYFITGEASLWDHFDVADVSPRLRDGVLCVFGCLCVCL